METSCKWHRPAIVVCIVLFAIVSCVFYNSQEAVNNPRPVDSAHNVTDSLVESHQNTSQMLIEKKTQLNKFVIHKPTFPHCVREHIYTVLAGILQEIHVRQTMCIDSDCHTHNLNGNTDMTDNEEDAKESSGMFVVYVVISLLLVSLVAAFLEVYRARKTPVRSRDKPELSRRCSLADLTVLRHNRRESMMMRRDSVLHMSFDSATSNHRVPLKLLGSSDIRRGSLPVAQAKINKWQRSMSADKADETGSDTHHRIHHMIRHH